MKTSVDHWNACWCRLGISEPNSELYLELVARYNEPHRKYHTLQHLEECFTKFDDLRNLASHPAEIEMSLWFHDAIYSTLRHDNEQKSAELAIARLEGAKCRHDVINRIVSLILSTRHLTLPADRDAVIMVDVDLSILGASAARFREYENQIRQEYSHIPKLFFSTKRKKIIQEFLNRPRIFQTQLFFERYEQQARDNLLASMRDAASKTMWPLL